MITDNHLVLHMCERLKKLRTVFVEGGDWTNEECPTAATHRNQIHILKTHMCRPHPSTNMHRQNAHVETWLGSTENKGAGASHQKTLRLLCDLCS